MTTADTIRLDRLDARIRSVWVRGQALHLLAGALVFLRWLVPLFLLGVLIDWMTYMPTAGRVLILMVVVGVPLYRAWRWGWQHLRPFNAVRTALQLEARHGELQSLLVSAIQLRGQGGDAGSSGLRARTCQLAEEAATDLEPRRVVPLKPLQKPGVVAALVVVVIAVFAVIDAPFLGAGIARIFTPWTALEYPTDTRITLAQEQLIVKEGDSAEIVARLSGVIPDAATIYVRTGQGRARAIDLEVIDNASTYAIASASRDFTYRIYAGDDRTPWHTVRVIAAPRVERVAVGLAYPEYLGREDDTIEALTLTVPEGTDVNWELGLDRRVRSAKFVRDGQAPVELEVADDGRSLAFTADVAASQGYHFTWTDAEMGYAFTSPRYFLQVAADQAPRVELSRPASNLVAMLGRPLGLAVRVYDDHGIGSAKVAYRVNQLAEKTVELPATAQAGQGEQAIDWDYRASLPDLQIGDTVSVAVQVRDQYPGPEGPHVVRSETRRITFLSKQQYLEQINKQRDRLLSRVQNLYRQQRNAHEIVRELSPAAEGYLQACQLEAIRQEMIRDQLKQVAAQLQGLFDDLAANGVAEEAQGQDLEAMRAALTRIAESDVARAADLLREQSASAAQGKADGPQRSADAVNTAARELGSLVLLRGIAAAQEVYARECRMLAQLQAALRWQTVMDSSSSRAARLIERQNNLADWTDQLLADLQAGMRYDKRSLAVLRLIRSIKDLRDAQTLELMRRAATRIDQKQPDQASASQADVVKALLDAEFSVRLSGRYTTLLQIRDKLSSIAAAQQQLITDQADLTATQFEARARSLARAQAGLRQQLLTLLLPSVPAPRPRLFDETPPRVPPIDELLAEINQAMARTLEHLASQEQRPALEQQRVAQRTLGRLLEVVDRWAVQVGLESQGLSTLVAATSERMSRLEEFEARVIGLLEKTDLAAAAKQKVDTLAESQQVLAGDLAAFIKSLKQQDQEQPDPDLPPLLSRIEDAERSLNQAAAALGANNADEAIDGQVQAADTLAEAYAIAVAQNQRLTLLQGMLMFQRSVGFASTYMADLVAEQRDLLQATRALKPQEMKTLLPRFAHLRACMHDIAPLLDLVASRLDVGTPLAFAKTDFADAMVAVETGDDFVAVDAQDVAAESLGQVQGLVEDIRVQTGYLAEIVEYLHAHVSGSSVIAYRQRQLSRELTAAPHDDLERFAAAQQRLLSQAQQHAAQLDAAAGNPRLTPPADPLSMSAEPPKPEPVLQDPAAPMALALSSLEAGDAAAAAQHMREAERIYAENADALLAVITMLHGVPQVQIIATTPPELVRLIDTLAVASKLKQLLRQTTVADNPSLAALETRQRGLATRLGEIAASGETHPLLNAADRHLAQAAAAFGPADRDALSTRQAAADRALRHFVVEQALILETKVPPPAASDLPTADGPGSDSEADVTAGFIADFVSGEVPSDQRSEWKVLGERNRAALNQNFARELPLEYRGLLKNYYERVAK